MDRPCSLGEGTTDRVSPGGLRRWEREEDGGRIGWIVEGGGGGLEFDVAVQWNCREAK